MKKTILFFTLCLSLSAGACASAKTPVSQSTILAEDLSDSQEDDILIVSPNPFTVCATMSFQSIQKKPFRYFAMTKCWKL